MQFVIVCIQCRGSIEISESGQKDDGAAELKSHNLMFLAAIKRYEPFADPD